MSSPKVVERKWTSHPGNVQNARNTIRRILEDYVTVDLDLVELAVGEACANAVEHGSPDGEASCFVVRCIIARDEGTVSFEVEDEGSDFALKNLSLGHRPDLTSEGGRGLYLINQIMDEVALHSSPRGLTLRMVKRFVHPTAWRDMPSN